MATLYRQVGVVGEVLIRVSVMLRAVIRSAGSGVPRDLVSITPGDRALDSCILKSGHLLLDSLSRLKLWAMYQIGTQY